MPLTNRDIYLAIHALTRDPARSLARSLEEYLRAMLRICRGHREKQALAVDEFLETLRASFTASPLLFDEQWAKQYDTRPEKGYAAFESTLLRHVVDLREMRAKGTLNEKWIELGVNSPRGARWYNFHPASYLECAAAGSIGGWEPGDDTGRQFVPGEVAVLGDDGKIASAHPEEIDRPIYPFAEVTWAQFTEFIECGQMYE